MCIAKIYSFLLSNNYYRKKLISTANLHSKPKTTVDSKNKNSTH